MRLSFVIPSRNQARFLRECLDSCLAQGIPDSEIIVMDGASTDDTREVLASYGDRVRWTSQPDSGQSEALNKAVQLARGDVIAWVNSDDYYVSSKSVSRLLTELEADPQLDVVYGDGLRVDIGGKVLGEYVARPILRAAEVVIHPSSFVQQPSLLFRRQLFLDVGGLDESMHYAMDYDLWTRLFERARRTLYVPEPISCARYHVEAKSIHAMGKQIRETIVVKWRASRRQRLGARDLARAQLGIVSLGAYWLAVRLGLLRAA